MCSAAVAKQMRLPGPKQAAVDAVIARVAADPSVLPSKYGGRIRATWLAREAGCSRQYADKVLREGVLNGLVAQNAIGDLHKNSRDSREALILNCLAKNPKASNRSIAQETGTDRRTVTRIRQAMRAKGEGEYDRPEELAALQEPLRQLLAQLCEFRRQVLAKSRDEFFVRNGNSGEVVSLVNDISRLIRESLPWAGCPHCGGNDSPFRRGTGCKFCDDSGILTQWTHIRDRETPLDSPLRAEGRISKPHPSQRRAPVRRRKRAPKGLL